MQIAHDPPIRLRPTQAGDFPFLDGLHEVLRRPALEAAGAWDGPRERERLRGMIRLGLDQIVELHGRDIGIFAMTAEPHRLWLRRIQLLPAAQGRGVGTALLCFALAEGKRLGLPVFLRVRRDNPACRLYARHGFRITGEASGDRLEMVAHTDKL